VVSTLLSTTGVVLHSRAVTTKLFELDSADAFAEGELDRTSVSSLGEVTVGRDVRRIPLENVALVWCALAGRGDEVFLGTGNDGKVLALRGEQTEVWAETGELIVSALSFGEGGDLYAGTIPGGKILRIRGRGRVETFAELPEVEHVWALEWDEQRHVLFAGTGPSGQVFSIDRTGRAEVFYDSEETHVLSLARGEGSDLYAGTSPEAILLKIDAPGRGRAVHDFEATEVKAIARRGSDVFVAVNEFPSPPTPPSKGLTKSTESEGATKAPGATKGSKRQGKGSLFRVGGDGRVDRLVKNDAGHLTDVEAEEGRVTVSVGEDGRILSVDDDRTVRTLIDVEERQVLALALAGRHKVFGTGDAAAVYRVLDSRPQDATYLTKVLDAGFRSQFGAIAWRGRGPIVVQARSGNTAKPDTSWSDWSESLQNGGRVPSPAARYVQVRVKFDPAQDSVLHALRVHYLNQNQRPLVTEIEAVNKGEPAKVGEVPEHSSVFKLTWKVDNPDTDPLRYRLAFRREGDDTWRPITRGDEILTKTEYEWNSESVAAGWYVVRVEASDERGNPAGRVERHEKLSRPVLVDNAPPRVVSLEVAGRAVRGEVSDGESNVVRIEYAVDGGEWRLLFPSDELYDQRAERFDAALPDEIGAGTRIVAVRAFDEGGNQAASQTSARIPAPPGGPAPAPAKRPPRR